MADDTTTAEKPADDLTVSFDSSKIKSAPALREAVSKLASATQTAKERLRAFEDENFGADAVRVSGDIERGMGSPFAAMEGDKRKQYTAIEALVDAEKKLADSSAALASAQAEHEAALAAVAALEANAAG